LKNVGIIVLNWQNWRDTLACLNSLKKLVFSESINIIVCDNGSEDVSFTKILNWAQQNYALTEIGVWFSDYFPEIPANLPTLPFVLIQTSANLGFAGGNNVGIRYALATKTCTYLWLLNNDTLVETQALSALYDYAETQPHLGLIGSTIIDYYQRDQVQCAGGCRYSPLLTVFRPVCGGESLNTVMQKPTVKLDYVYGASLFFRVTAVEQVGLLNEEYFLFYEELDYSQRLRRQNYDIGWCKNSWVYHKGSASIGKKSEGNREKLQTAQYYENLSTLKYTANFYPRLLPLVMLLRFVLKSLILTIRGDFFLLPSLLKAYRDFTHK